MPLDPKQFAAAVLTEAEHAALSHSGLPGVGKLVQELFFSTASVIACGVLPNDDTIPQNTEGTEVLTGSITPTNVNNKLVIEFTGWLGGNSDLAGVALFQDSIADAIAASIAWGENGGLIEGGQVTLRHEMVAGTTSPTTFKIRAGAPLTTTYLNADSGGTRKYGGVMRAVLTIREKTP